MSAELDSIDEILSDELGELETDFEGSYNYVAQVANYRVRNSVHKSYVDVHLEETSDELEENEEACYTTNSRSIRDVQNIAQNIDIRYYINNFQLSYGAITNVINISSTPKVQKIYIKPVSKRTSIADEINKIRNTYPLWAPPEFVSPINMMDQTWRYPDRSHLTTKDQLEVDGKFKLEARNRQLSGQFIQEIHRGIYGACPYDPPSGSVAYFEAAQNYALFGYPNTAASALDFGKLNICSDLCNQENFGLKPCNMKTTVSAEPEQLPTEHAAPVCPQPTEISVACAGTVASTLTTSSVAVEQATPANSPSLADTNITPLNNSSLMNTATPPPKPFGTLTNNKLRLRALNNFCHQAQAANSAFNAYNQHVMAAQSMHFRSDVNPMQYLTPQQLGHNTVAPIQMVPNPQQGNSSFVYTPRGIVPLARYGEELRNPQKVQRGANTKTLTNNMPNVMMYESWVHTQKAVAVASILQQKPRPPRAITGGIPNKAHTLNMRAPFMGNHYQYHYPPPYTPTTVAAVIFAAASRTNAVPANPRVHALIDSLPNHVVTPYVEPIIANLTAPQHEYLGRGPRYFRSPRH